ncbi:MAG: flagellar biosynthetic protein FliR [Polyangiaceae bacterium]|nr:flagellar biosynthetic protein FliR [Polyangiaceae bacterium]
MPMNLPPIDDLAAMGLAWARVMPTVTLVPAFGLKALPTSARGILGLALAAAIYPSLVPIVVAERSLPWAFMALEQMALGMPVALAAAIPLWAAAQAGGLVDVLRGSPDGPGLAVIEGRASSFGVLFGVFASVVFLSTGGAARAAEALSITMNSTHPVFALLVVARNLVSGITLSLAIGAPVLAASIVLELTFALIARAASPAQVHALFAPVRALGLLAIVAIVLERIASLIALTVRAPF